MVAGMGRNERLNRAAERRRLAARLAKPFGRVVHRRMLRDAGITRDEVRSEIRAARWTALGKHTVLIGPPDSDLLTTNAAGEASPRPSAWPAVAAWAVWESGSGALLDGSSALRAAGLERFADDLVHVTIPHGRHATRLPGVRLHRSRNALPTARGGLPRVSVEAATIHAAEWAVSDRQAALLLVMPVQQGLTTGDRLMGELASRAPLRRRELITLVVRDIAEGVNALGELDFARLCQTHGIPTPTRQEMCDTELGRSYLDVWWESHQAGAEIDGVQHGWGLTAAEDMLRDNEMLIEKGPIMRIPVLLLRSEADRVMDQVARFLASREAA